MTKKIALLHFAYPPNPGGVEKMMQVHAQVLQRLGFSVKILTGSGSEQNKKIELVELPVLGSLKNFNPKLQEKILDKNIIDSSFYDLSDQILEKLEENLGDSDVVLVHNMLTLYRNLPFIYAFRRFVGKNRKKKFINWVHDHTLIEEEKIKDVKMNSFIKDLITKPIVGVSYITISQTFASLLKNIIKGVRIEVIPDGLDIKSELEIGDDVWNIVQKNNLLSKSPLLLCPVNIVERKNLEYSIKLISLLKKDFPNVFLIVTGDVSKHKNTVFYFENLKKIVKEEKLEDSVLFLAQVFRESRTNKDIRDLYMLSDGVLYFSKSENFGLPIAEASFYRIPIFLSNLKVFKEVGKENFEYIDIGEKDSLSKSASFIKSHFQEDKNFKMRNMIKSEYNLENILKERLIPLLNG